RPKGAVARFSFDRPPALLVKEFGTERKAGWWILSRDDPGPLAKLGPEPFSDEFALFVLEGSDTGRVHALLRDQRRVAGIGRGYLRGVSYESHEVTYCPSGQTGGRILADRRLSRLIK